VALRRMTGGLRSVHVRVKPLAGPDVDRKGPWRYDETCIILFILTMTSPISAKYVTLPNVIVVNAFKPAHTTPLHCVLNSESCLTRERPAVPKLARRIYQL
jgi:hypothetical protein